MWPVIVPAGEARLFELGPGEQIEIINVAGSQVADMWAFNADDISEFMSMEHSRLHIGRVVPRAGDALVTNRRRPILTLTLDQSPGIHDTLLAACDQDRYRLLGHQGPHRNCRDNLISSMRKLGVELEFVPSPFNLFENAPISADGSIAIEPPAASPGDYVRFRAEMILFLAISACPQDLVPTNGLECRPQNIEVRLAC